MSLLLCGALAVGSILPVNAADTEERILVNEEYAATENLSNEQNAEETTPLQETELEETAPVQPISEKEEESEACKPENADEWEISPQYTARSQAEAIQCVHRRI